MSYYANRAERLDLIAGLRALAKFLEGNEDVPSPKWVDVMVFPHESSEDADRREIDRTAALIGTIAQKTTAGHYEASRKFGPIEYRAIAVPKNNGEAQK